MISVWLVCKFPSMVLKWGYMVFFCIFKLLKNNKHKGTRGTEFRGNIQFRHDRVVFALTLSSEFTNIINI